MATETDPVIVRIIASQRDLEKSLASSVRATERAAQKMEKNLSGIGSGGGGRVVQFGRDVTKSTQQATQAAGQLSFQLNDIATSLSGGASPFQVMMQQGSQVAQVMQQVKAQGGSMGSVVTAAFTSMLNPVSLLSFGLIALAGYALQYFQTMDEGGKDSEKVLKQQQQDLDAVINKWGDLLPTLKEIAEARKRLAEAQQVRDTGGVEIAKQYDAARTAVSNLLPDIIDMQVRLQQMGEDDLSSGLRGGLDDLNLALKENRATAADLQPILAALLAMYAKYHDDAVLPLIGALAAQASGLGAAADKTKEITEDMAKATAAQLAFNTALGKMPDIAKAQQSDVERLLELYNEAIRAISTLEDRQQSVLENRALKEFVDNRDRVLEQGAGPTASREGLRPRAVNARIASRLDKLDDTFAERLDVLLQKFPGIKIASAYRSFEEQAKIYDSGVRPAARPGRSLHQYGTAVDLSPGGQDSAAFRQRLYEEARKLGITFPVKGDPYHAQLAGAKVPTQPGEETTKRQKEANTDLDDWNKKMVESIALQRDAIAINQDGTKSINEKKAAIEEEKLFQQGLNEAIGQYGTVSEAQRAQIRATAHEAAQLGLVADNIAAAQRTIAQQSEEQKRRAEELSQAITQTAQTALGGFINDLRNGVKAGDAFRNMLDRVIDSIIQFTIQQMFAKNALGGMLGGFLGGFGGGAFAVTPGAGLFSAGGTVGLSQHRDGRKFSPALWSGAPRYATGGVAGLRPGEMAAILHKGELVIPRSARGRSGSGAPVMQSTSLGDVNIDMSQSGTVAAGSEQAKQFGINVQKLIQLEMVKESRPGGLLRRVPA